MDSETLSAQEIKQFQEFVAQQSAAHDYVCFSGGAVDMLPALLSMAARTLDAEQKQAELQRQVIDAQKQAQEAEQEAEQGRVEAVERAQKAEGELETWKRRARSAADNAEAFLHEITALKKAMQNMSMLGRRIQAHSTTSEKVKELALHLRRTCEDAYPPCKPSILREDALPSFPLCLCHDRSDGVSHIHPACPVHGAEGEFVETGGAG